MKMNGTPWSLLLKTLLSDPKNLEIWSFISPTFPKDFVNFVDEKIKEGQIYTKN